MELEHLGQLKPGDRGTVAGLGEAARPFRRKLLAMGITPGCTVEVVRVAPLGDPIEVSLRGFRLCLRHSEAAVVSVQREAA
ncbi:ferrous iron transport protein A [Laribacter hongkongensis]|uniref:Ferrous iron transport protein A n=1 Tax=Laribacter hongkongensis TaxID=168471 RepID=A0ABD4SMC7_9NEIS|nr:FeoA family protein [Laribacter hongkongensis]MCG9024875.1 ferrous iron transport protein A [Laribacter hongkongensis]MCG9101518.1 ferrous iron transport protein A [Laribacter hongkongensis]MCG9102403.1 ferrous iron transport protein A [Laribacter hongkongensis]MCG9112445.1 ferrous iron transport protein A [Laribacter hongkongensis]MCG9119327.1 ferrous iron transport protein A [Laribacter hongkongensis]